MPRRPLIGEDQLSLICEAVKTESMTAIAARYKVSVNTLGEYLRRHGVLPTFDGWRTAQYDDLLGRIGHQSTKRIASEIGTSPEEIKNRVANLAARIQREGLTLVQLAIVTKVDRVYWSQYIKAGWVTPNRHARGNRVTLEELRKLILDHPELFDYRRLPTELAELLGLNGLPEPPRYKLVTCHSKSIESKVVEVRKTKDAGEIRYKVQSCAEMGGVDFWAAIYSIPTCPRCGVRVSRFSEKAQYGNQPGNADEIKDAMAQKIGLRWREGHFCDPKGTPLNGDEVRQYVYRITVGNSRDWLRKSQLVEDIEHYQVRASEEDGEIL